MNQVHPQSISPVSEDVNLMVANVTQDKIRAIIRVSVNVKNHRSC